MCNVAAKIRQVNLLIHGRLNTVSRIPWPIVIFESALKLTLTSDFSVMIGPQLSLTSYLQFMWRGTIQDYSTINIIALALGAVQLLINYLDAWEPLKLKSKRQTHFPCWCSERSFVFIDTEFTCFDFRRLQFVAMKSTKLQ